MQNKPLKRRGTEETENVGFSSVTLDLELWNDADSLSHLHLPLDHHTIIFVPPNSQSLFTPFLCTTILENLHGHDDFSPTRSRTPLG
jgi:hypothetical protein